MAIKYVRLDTDLQPAPPTFWNRLNKNMFLARIVFIFVASFCVFLYFSDMLIDIDLNSRASQQNINRNLNRNISEEYEPSAETDFINQISLVKISDRINTTSCLLPHLDPWDSSISQYLNPATDPLKTCKPSVEVRSFISDAGELEIIELAENEICWYRCIYPTNDRNLKYGDWIKLTDRSNDSILVAWPKCDVFDVNCGINDKTSYKYLHSHIYEKNPKTTLPTSPMPYDVHILVIDSVSMSQIFRSLPMTVHFIRNELDAIPIPFLNKAGLNSRPNGYAFLLNERGPDLPKSPWSKGMKGGRSSELCKKWLDNETFIGYDFQKNGYRTMMNEDWSRSVFTHPDCKSFSKPQVDHMLKPYLLRLEDWTYKDKDYYNILFKKACKEKSRYVLGNLRNFMLKYPNEPKFSLNWITDLAHDDSNGLYHTDVYFREFFRRMEPRLKNSFLFFMGDHGGRLGKVRNTEIGVFEDNNPFLFTILPENLRSNHELFDQIHENAKEIVSHYDLYATMLEIATTSSKWTRTSKFPGAQFDTSDRKLKGSSLFHKLKQPRDCDSLQIPYNYCNCQHPSELIKDEKELAVQIGQKIVEKINKDIRESVQASKCSQLELDQNYTTSLREYERGLHQEKRIIKAHLRVNPSGGLYEGFVEVREKQIILVDEQFPRLNTYKDQAFCISQSFMQNYCYCTSLLKKN